MYPKSSLEGKMWAVNASAKEHALVLPVNGACFALRSLPRRLRNAEGKSESPGRAQAHTVDPLTARASSKESKRGVQTTEISVNRSILVPKYPNSQSIQIPSALGELGGAR